MISTAVAIRSYIGIGANLGEPVAQCRSAISALKNLQDTRFVLVSSLYQSEPMGPPDQPPYINGVAALDSSLSAEALLDQLQAIENSHARRRDSGRWSARTLDLDLLLFGDQIINSDRLIVPHPGITERSFVILPLTEIAPDVLIPGLGRADAFIDSAAAYAIRKLELSDHEN